MFSRDSQVSRDRNSSPPEYRNPAQNAVPAGRPDYVEKPTSAGVLPLRARQSGREEANTESPAIEKTGVEGLSAESVNSEQVSAEQADQAEPKETTERSQSWQIAPDLFSSFRYAWAGISYAFQTQRNFRIHTGVGSVAIILCWALKVSNLEIAIICLTIGAVLVMEILNTALESLVDLTVGQTYHTLAKVAKDCAAGAVLMAAIVALLIAILIFAPPLWAILSPFISSILSS